METDGWALGLTFQIAFFNLLKILKMKSDLNYVFGVTCKYYNWMSIKLQKQLSDTKGGMIPLLTHAVMSEIPDVKCVNTKPKATSYSILREKFTDSNLWHFSVN